MRIFLVGFSGAGKTYWGKKWGEAHQIKYYDLDEEISVDHGESVTDIFEKLGERAFRNLEKEALEYFLEIDDFILSCGGGTPCFFDNMDRMNEEGTTIYLHATPQQIYNRVITETDKRPLLKKIEPSEIKAFIDKKLRDREPSYRKAKIILDTEKINDTTFEKILRSLEQV
ncbi:MAG: shikimate kinase [Chitinophagaceae bacterium]